ncbi:hypothetical protein I3843_12G009000 [Carya illinoinensis]|uniref:TCP domain-containing protein n=1 Tax=Carya illinoinensis TaxID=32201 RepID=A0A8T1NVX2_CARIL|nr:transcription factor TCP5-like [Carya illinoinensis]KAG2675530.1 hypothetical protein I3760_12G007700 [Carya illinoinensis]KAG6632880.1 hypothetical protein CIPAW_12G009000 [Carya illinoinensis]KAG6683363.1 hypothetical protein I3842_12G007900 [Carya illinoinensis]KAG7951494.1 hypothetical protein I3843_12G009000 [Carya illinoinensis]
MISNSREKDIQAKQEGGSRSDIGKLSKVGASSGSRQWSAGFRNPRIVRVSRSFGGKDRHSKVCTIRGLRDRRIRLSVPTAIQLYDLQDRLGLSQPSKVVDWLLEATKFDIDKLPPLPIPQGFGQFHHQLSHHESNVSPSSFAPNLFDANSSTFIMDGEDQRTTSMMAAKTKDWDHMDSALKLKRKEFERSGSLLLDHVGDKGKWIKTNHEEDEIQYGIGTTTTGYGAQISAHNFFPMPNHTPLPSLLNNAMAYNSYYQSDQPSALSLSQFGGHGSLFPSQIDHHPHSTSTAMPLPSGSQLFFCPSSTTPALFTPFPSYITTPIESDPRQFSHIQLLNSSSQHHVLPHPLISSFHSVGSPLKPFPANESPKLQLPQSHESKLD